jgi:hypothetical protein
MACLPSKVTAEIVSEAFIGFDRDVSLENGSASIAVGK